MRVKIFIVLISVFFFVDSFSQTVTKKDSINSCFNPFTFCTPSLSCSYENALAFFSNRSKFEVLKISGTSDYNYRWIEFSYDGGIDWLAGCHGNSYITTVTFRNNKLEALRIYSREDLDCKAYAAYAVKYFTEYYGFEPECIHQNYKPKGAEVYYYIWELNDFKISVIIRDYNNSWRGWFDIYVNNKKL